MTLRHTLIASVLLFAALVFATVAASAERGMRKSLQEDPPAVDLSTLKTLSAVVEKLAQKKIVYVEGRARQIFASSGPTRSSPGPLSADSEARRGHGNVSKAVPE